MRSFRNQLRRVVLGALPAAALACSTGHGASTSGSGTGSGSGSSSSSGSTNGCSLWCGCVREVRLHVAPFDGGFDDGGPMGPGICELPCLPDAGNHQVDACSAVPDPNGGGGWELHCTIHDTCTGRRPEGLCPPEVASQSILGDHFARMAHLEAASVPAFRRMARELKAHGAPASLVRVAQRSACDEIRHARTMTRFARAHGSRVPSVAHAAHGMRTIAEFALENAIEGCVRETLGAAMALAQSRLAPDPELRAAMATIAEDELRHAELAHHVQAWVLPKLSGRAQRRVAVAQRQAFRELSRLPTTEAVLSRAIGLPDQATQARILFGLKPTLVA